METAVTIGLDLGKSVFQVHGVDAGGTVVVQRRLTRSRLLQFFAKQAPCLVGMEACAAAHHWGRELQKLGHRVRLMPPSYVKPYVKRQKNDAADAEAICEAVTRPTMRFVEIKTCEQQGTLVLHRVRLMLMRQRVQLSGHQVYRLRRIVSGQIRPKSDKLCLAAPFYLIDLNSIFRAVMKFLGKNPKYPAKSGQIRPSKKFSYLLVPAEIGC